MTKKAENSNETQNPKLGISVVSGSLPLWWWSDLSDKFYESKKAHDYKDGKIDYRFIRAWFLDGGVVENSSCQASPNTLSKKNAEKAVGALSCE